MSRRKGKVLAHPTGGQVHGAGVYLRVFVKVLGNSSLVVKSDSTSMLLCTGEL